MGIKVLHIVSGDIWAGSETQMLFQLQELSRQGIEVGVLLFNKARTWEQYVQAGLTCFLADERQGFFVMLNDSLQVVKAYRPQIIISHGYKENLIGGVLSLLNRLPLVTTFHGLVENYRGVRKHKMKAYLWLNRMIWKWRSAKLVTVSQKLADDLNVSHDVRTVVIKNVIDTGAVRERQDGLFLKKPAVLFVGRLVGVKRCDIAIRAFAQALLQCEVKPKLYIAGDGELKAELEGLTESLGIREHVCFLGFRPDITDLIVSSDLLLMSSDSEGIPTVLLEAIFAGVPVVATSVGGIPEVVGNFSEYPVRLVSSGNVEGLSTGILEMLGVKISETELVRCKNEFMQHFSPMIAAKTHIQLYKELCG